MRSISKGKSKATNILSNARASDFLFAEGKLPKIRDAESIS